MALLVHNFLSHLHFSQSEWDNVIEKWGFDGTSRTYSRPIYKALVQCIYKELNNSGGGGEIFGALLSKSSLSGQYRTVPLISRIFPGRGYFQIKLKLDGAVVPCYNSVAETLSQVLVIYKWSQVKFDLYALSGPSFVYSFGFLRRWSI